MLGITLYFINVEIKGFLSCKRLIFNLGAGVCDVFWADATARVFKPRQLRLQLNVLLP